MPRPSYPYFGPSGPAISTIWSITRTIESFLRLIALRVRDQVNLDYAFPSKTRYSPQSTQLESRSVHFRLFRRNRGGTGGRALVPASWRGLRYCGQNYLRLRQG